jgi:hypothetical protein
MSEHELESQPRAPQEDTNSGAIQGGYENDTRARSTDYQGVVGRDNYVSVASECGCQTETRPHKNNCQMAVRPWVYAVGRIEPRFPRLSVEKEFAQATGRSETAGLSDRQALHAVLSDPKNRYLVRQLCWVLRIEGLETYILQPRDPGDLDLLVEALRSQPEPTDVDVVVGARGPLAPPELCNGLVVPFLVFDQIYSFDVDSLLEAIPRPDSVAEDGFRAMAKELFFRMLQMTDNAGATDEHRATNYLILRYSAIYARAAAAFAQNYSLSGVDVRPSPLSNTRNIVEVIFAYTSRETDFTEKYFVRVDVTEEFPFLVTKLSPFYDH